jgi:hypothetical protein
MTKLLALEMKLLSPWEPCWGTWRGGSFTGEFEEKKKKKAVEMGVSLSL